MREKTKHIPAYLEICKTLKRNIENGKYDKKLKLPKEQDLATEYDVNRLTIRKSLDILVREGYVRKINGRGTFIIPDRKQNRTIIVLGNDSQTWKRTSMQQITCAAMVQFKEAGFNIEVETRQNLEKVLSNHVSGIKKVNGILVLRPGYDVDPEFKTVDKVGIPIVTEGRGGHKYHQVLFDNESGVRKLVYHLHDLGHREIGIAYSEGHRGWETDLRLSCMKQVLNELGCLKKNNICRIMSSLYKATPDNPDIHHFLKRKPLPTALMCLSDHIAVNVIHSATKLGIQVPTDLSVTGFDNLPIAEFCNPSLTTLSYNSWEYGTETAKLLLKQINNYSIKQEIKTVKGELQIRESTTYPK